MANLRGRFDGLERATAVGPDVLLSGAEVGDVDILDIHSIDVIVRRQTTSPDSDTLGLFLITSGPDTLDIHVSTRKSCPRST